MKKKQKVLIAAGGSGGHLLPAQQLAESLQLHADVFFAGHGLSRSPFFERGRHLFYEIPAAPLNRRLFSFMKSMLFGVVESVKLLRSERPDIVVGFGSFHCFPLLLAALFLRKKIVLFEANCQLGKVNRFFSPFAKSIAMQFGKSRPKICLTPLLPWKEREERPDQRSARRELGLSEERTTLLIFGGSQGASFLNRTIPSLLPLEVQVIHLTGKEEWVEEVANAYRAKKISAVVKSFESNMSRAYAAADGAICRSGAGTVAELIRYGIPALLIPFPHATDDHQRANAEFLAKKVGGATMLLQEEERHLPHRIEELLSERGRLREALNLFATECEGRTPFWEQILK